MVATGQAETVHPENFQHMLGIREPEL